MKEIHRDLGLEDEENGDLINIREKELQEAKQYVVMTYAFNTGYRDYVRDGMEEYTEWLKAKYERDEQRQQAKTAVQEAKQSEWYKDMRDKQYRSAVKKAKKEKQKTLALTAKERAEERRLAMKQWNEKLFEYIHRNDKD